MRERILYILLAAAGLLVTYGAAWYSIGAGFITAGVFIGAGGWLFLGDLPDPADEGTDE